MFKLLAAENGFVHACGHRGHSIGAPENTLVALTATREEGGTSAEIDIVLTKDGEIVLMHDLTLDRTTDGTGLVAETDLEDVARLDAGGWFDPRFKGERVPTLAMAIRHAQAIGLGLVVEIKEREAVERLIGRLAHVLEETKGAPQLVIISFDHVVLKEVKRAIPGVRTEGITHARHADIVGVAEAAGLDSVSIEHLMFRPEDGHALHGAGVAVRVHLERPAVYERYRALGRDLLAPIRAWLAEGAVDTLSGDDVGFLAAIVRKARAQAS